MLGWEYPPHISGGLGTACEGLTRGLARQGISIDFVVPHVYGGEKASHMNLSEPPKDVGPKDVGMAQRSSSAPFQDEGTNSEPTLAPTALDLKRLEIEIQKIPSFLQPYLRDFRILRKNRPTLPLGLSAEKARNLPEVVSSLFWISPELKNSDGHYHGDLFDEVARFTFLAASANQNTQADLIHAHDWMTFPAAIVLKALTGLPLVLHVHSLEMDRTGGSGNPRIEEIEKAGLHAADRVIAVSYYTRQLIHERYGIPLEKISVVHNGVYVRELVENYRKEATLPSKIVLFLGRITFQKGPDYFVEAAAKVIPHVPDVLFVMAGSGDMLPRMMERVSELGINKNFLFTGFLKGQDVEKMFSLASLYVMPSVSEPFGIAPLEAISFHTPTIISKQSGVSEVLKHSLKVDFWDVENLANMIIAALKYPALQQDIVALASEEIKSLHWDAAAQNTVKAYLQTLGQLTPDSRT